MGKKILYIVIIVAVIIAGIFTAKQISDNNKTKQTSTNTVNDTNKTEVNNEVEENSTNEVENSKKENNIEENEVHNEADNGNTKLTPEEQAKKIVKDHWGEDDAVYFSYDGKDENGRYIICVREQSTTKALYRYYVNVESGTFDIE